jgi:hypothetical protein
VRALKTIRARIKKPCSCSRYRRHHNAVALSGAIRAGFPHWDASSPDAVIAHDRLVHVAIESEVNLAAVVRVRRVPQAHQAEPQDHLILPMCLRCRAPAMSLTCTEEEYPGYQRRMFECLVCGETMTQWAGVHQKALRKPQ